MPSLSETQVIWHLTCSQRPNVVTASFSFAWAVLPSYPR